MPDAFFYENLRPAGTAGSTLFGAWPRRARDDPRPGRDGQPQHGLGVV